MVRQIRAGVVISQLADGEQCQRGVIEKDRIVSDADIRQNLRKLRPNLIVAFSGILLRSQVSVSF